MHAHPETDGWERMAGGGRPSDQGFSWRLSRELPRLRGRYEVDPVVLGVAVVNIMDEMYDSAPVGYASGIVGLWHYDCQALPVEYCVFPSM